MQINFACQLFGCSKLNTVFGWIKAIWHLAHFQFRAFQFSYRYLNQKMHTIYYIYNNIMKTANSNIFWGFFVNIIKYNISIENCLI